MTSNPALDFRALAEELRRRITGEVRFDAGSRALYSTDSSNYRQVPVGVVIPRSEQDIIETVAACRSFEAPLLMRGGGTSLAGQCCNVAVVLDTTKYLYKVLKIDPEQRTARVQPGVVLDCLQAEAGRFNLIFAPDPSTHNECTLGGMIGNNSCGTHSLMGGKTSDNVEELEILTYDGLHITVGETSDEELSHIIREGGRRADIYTALLRLRDRYEPLIRSRFPRIPRRVSGYNLEQLLPENRFHVARALVGTEGTCAAVISAKVRLLPAPRARALVVFGFSDLAVAADHVPQILTHRPIALEGLDRTMLDHLKMDVTLKDRIDAFPRGGGLLLVELSAGNELEARDRALALIEDPVLNAGALGAQFVADPGEVRETWRIREAGLAGLSRGANGQEFWGGWEDSAVAPERAGSYLRDLNRLRDQYHYRGSAYGHFGQGCIHVRLDFDFRTPEGVARFRSFMEEAADLVVSYDGSLSGEHGDGQSRAELYQKMFGEELVQAFREFKAIWDPAGRMNPGKLVDPYRMDENLRIGSSYAPWQPATRFGFVEDRGNFEKAALRCVGFGKCRRETGGTMCPSYMATREEKHSTRGRARLLFEMLHGEVIKDRWRSSEVREALDLCLACKACKTECPVNVDMATYKAEFLSHYYEGRLRPRSSYVFGLVFWWARLASLAPRIANLAAQTPLLCDAIKATCGIAPERRIPLLAVHPFTSWFRRRPPVNGSGPTVVLWPDTFNNYFTPQTAQAAVEALEAAGYHVIVPIGSLCCGRPLYDYGMLGLARRKLQQVLHTLEPHITAGVPLVILEPSCASVFRDELPNLFPHEERAQRLSRQSFSLGEFLASRKYQPPQLRRRAIVHGHCHQNVIGGMRHEVKLMESMGLDLKTPEAGCCGMAGGFGFEKEHYDISMKLGERVLLPVVRSAGPEDLIVANGFSCREQIAQGAGRRALHLAEVIRMALAAHD